MIQKQASDNRPLYVSQDDARRLREGTLTQMRALESFKQMPHDQLDEVFFWGFEDMDQAVFTYDGNMLLYSPKYPIGRIIHVLTDQDNRVGSIQIIDIKVERIRNISHVDALAMGVTPMPHRDRKSGSSDSHIDAVLYNWNQWYAHEKFNTHRNPWCWVYHFKFSPPVKEELKLFPN